VPTREERIATWGYDPIADVEKLKLVISKCNEHPGKVKLAVVLAAGLVALVAADVAGWKSARARGRNDARISALVRAALSATPSQIRVAVSRLFTLT
jgi:hypothetical protein